MGNIELRGYQTNAIDQTEGAIVFGDTELCISAPTSFGKTYTIAQFIKNQIDEGKSVVFMMNLSALVEQTMEAMKNMGIPFRVIAAEYDGQEFDHQAKVTIAMQQTLFSRIDKVSVKCDTLVIDEYHRSFRTDTMNQVRKLLKPDVVVGLSATPYDEKGYALSGVEIIETVSVKDLTDQGFLTPLRTFSAEFAENMDYSEAGSGEYSEKFLNGVLNNDLYNAQVVKAWWKVAKDKKTIVFSTGIEHSEALAAQFATLGVEAKAYHSKLSKKDSRAIMSSFKKGTTQVLVSVNKILVGFDDPSIECGVACRPTKTRRVWQQACGRMIRLFEGKKDAILLDCAQWTAEHGFYDAPYHAPEFGEKELLKKAKEEVAIQVMPLLVEEEPTVVTPYLVIKKVNELEQMKLQIPDLPVKDLLAIYETSQKPVEILRVAHEINRRKTGQSYTRAKVTWISDKWDEMLEEFPQYRTRLLKTLRTMAKTKVSGGKKLASLHYVVSKSTKDMNTGEIGPGWLRQQTPYADYTMPDGVNASMEVINNYNVEIDDADIPF